jgi:cell division protein ZapE
VADVHNAALRDGFVLDTAQRALLDRLALLGAELDHRPLWRSRPRSLYIHGDAGRGKSWLADAFFARLPSPRKTRVHFHGFFDALHRSIHDHRSERDAVERAVADLTRESRLLFFDELHVHDAGDARLLTRLLDHVFQRGMTVLATSNYAPDDLLPNPIWHHTFEPGIALIAAHMDVWHLDGPVDYRTRNENHGSGFAAGSWTRTPGGSSVHAASPVRAASAAPAPSTASAVETLTVQGRTFAVTSADGARLTATFDQLCRAATSSVEYLLWARMFRQWVITDVPSLATTDADTQQRFITLVDVLSDADVTAHFSSTLDLPDFLAEASERPDAFRMTSRLQLLTTAPAMPHGAPRDAHPAHSR